MTAVSKNYDGLCYHLKVVHKNLDDPLKRKLHSFLDDIKSELIEEDGFATGFIEKKFPLILGLRLSALKWMETEQQSLIHLFDNETYPYFERMAENEKLSILAGNILFALRCNRKVINALLKKIGQKEFPNGAFFELPELSYDQFIAAIYLSAPNAEAAETAIEWLKSSFRIEYGILAASVIYDESLWVTSNKIEKLSTIIADAAQTYSAIASELGIFSSRKASGNILDGIESAGFLEDQNNLAEAGIQLFAQNWEG
jgi:hypothetical protein